MLFVLPFKVFGAAEEYVAILGSGLVDRGWRVTLLQPHGLASLGPVSRPEFDIVELDPPWLSSIRRVRAAVRAIAPDIVHVNHVFPPGIAAGLLSRSGPVVVTSHNPALVVQISPKGRLLSRAVEPKVDAWIALSARNRDLVIATGVLPERVHIVPNGLPPERFEGQLDRAGARKVLGLPQDAFVVGTLGRLARQKRHDLLLEACGRLRPAIPYLHVLLLGDGELRSQTEQLAARLMPGGVTLAGHRADAVRMLRAMDVFALPSDYEGLSFALLEAMATGLPMVVSDVQGSGEVIEDGKTGLVVPPGDVEPIADALRRLWQDAAFAEGLGRASRQEFYANYTADTMAERTMGVYRKVLSAGREGVAPGR